MDELEFRTRLIGILNKYSLVGPQRYKIMRDELVALYKELEKVPLERSCGCQCKIKRKNQFN